MGVWLAIAALVGCSGEDRDGDGFARRVDCDDSDPVVFPGADDANCDGIDQDCTGTPDDGGLGVWFRDLDEDGFGDPKQRVDGPCPRGPYVRNDDDCNDFDPMVHPDAPEVCSGQDDDCDGLADDEDVDVTGGTTWFVDADQDGYGDDHATVVACAPPPGTTAVGGDCDDNDAGIRPGAVERCAPPGVDDDCDGLVDDLDPDGVVDGTFAFEDADGDGFGGAVPVQVCALRPGASFHPFDCDDTDASVSPAADEVCDDARDDDCNGRIDDCGTLGGFAIDAVATLRLDPLDGQGAFGLGLDGRGDSDGDGAADLVVSQPGLRDEGWLSGAAWVFQGPLGEGVLDVADAVAVVRDASGEEAWFGSLVRWGGDVDGDGYGDLWVGAAGLGGVGLLLGPTRGTYAFDESEDFDVWCPTEHALGSAAAAGHDFDGRGGPDLAVGAAARSFHAGAVEVASVVGTSEPSCETATVFGTKHAKEFGAAVAFVPDLAGDGTTSIAVGAPGERLGDWVYTGPSSVFVASFATWEGEDYADGLPIALASAEDDLGVGASVAGLGDLDGDGYADLWVGAPGLGGGYVVRGPVARSESLASSAHTTLLGLDPGHGAGTAVATSGDLDRDGVPDLVVGAPGAAVGTAAEAGEVWVLVDLPEGTVDLSRSARAVVRGDSAVGVLGTSLSMVPDWDGDGRDELLVGAPDSAPRHDTAGELGTGRAWVIPGAAF